MYMIYYIKNKRQNTMQLTHRNSTRPQTLCSRVSSFLCKPRNLFCMPRNREVVIENLPQSLAELGNSKCHEAQVLTNQKNFKTLQKRLAQLLDKHITPQVRNQIINEQRQKEGFKTLLYVNDGHILNKDTGETKSDDLCKNISGIIAHIMRCDPSIVSKYDIVSEPFIRIGTRTSDVLHKDNGGSLDDDNFFYDYTIVIPIINYNLLNPNNHDYAPESTQIIPQQFKHIVSGYAEKNYYRGSIFYPNASEYAKKHLVSDKLTQGTATIIHTATAAGSDDDGDSVIHMSPVTPFGHLRCFILARANKKTKKIESVE